jgi:hypothetical protein
VPTNSASKATVPNGSPQRTKSCMEEVFFSAAEKGAPRRGEGRKQARRGW